MGTIKRTSAEFRLAVECCKAAFAVPRPHAQPPLAKIEWARFQRLASFHRIEGVAAAHLADDRTNVPDGVRWALSKASARIAAANLRAALDCQRLLQCFDAAEVPLLFLKGLAVGALAFRTPMMKSAVDIDLLIDPRDLRKSAGLLRECGFRLIAPEPSHDDERLLNWHRRWKESLWINPTSQLQLDLHTRVSDNVWLIPEFSVRSSRQTVDIGNGISLPTFATDEQFAYLSVHGASAVWFRLKWISELAGLLQSRTQDEIERLYRRSQELGAARAAGLALLLADDLFGTLGSDKSLRGELLKDNGTRRLHLSTLRMITRPPREPTSRPLGTLPIRRAQFFLRPELRFKLSELSGQAHRLLSRRPA